MDAPGVEALHAKLDRLQRAVDTLLARTSDPGERFCTAVLAQWGETPFRAADLLEWADEAPELRRDLRDAARALCGTSHRPTSRQLGCALQRLARIPMMWHGVDCEDDRGTALWSIRALQD